MAYLIKDSETDRIVRALAEAKGKPIIEAIREACVNELARERKKVPLWEQIQPIIQRIESYPLRDPTDTETDKEFFDRMWDDASHDGRCVGVACYSEARAGRS